MYRPRLAFLLALGGLACAGQESPTEVAMEQAAPPGAATTYAAQRLGVLGGLNSWASAVNPAGTVVGYSATLPTGDVHAFR